MKNSMWFLLGLVVVSCASVNRFDDGTSVSCRNFFFCQNQILSHLEKSQKKWVELGLKEYSYILSQWYPDEPPPCTDEVTVRVKDHVVVGAETVSCETKVKTQAEPEGLKGFRTFDEMYDDCREKVFAEAPSFARLSLWLDAKGVLRHCQFYEPYWGYHSGGRLTL